MDELMRHILGLDVWSDGWQVVQGREGCAWKEIMLVMGEIGLA
jgi:hypothetical protein